MKIIYTCDLHEDMNKYEALEKLASSEECNAIIIGGDIFKYTSQDISIQIEFVRNYLINFLKKLNIPVYIIKGNTDCLPAYKLLISYAPDNVVFLSESPAQIGSYLVYGFDLINISPFKIKNYERRDLKRDYAEYSPLLIRTDNGELVLKPADYLNSLPSLEEELTKYKGLGNSIFVCHVPPYGTKLDMNSIRSHAGSKAVYNFILQMEPLLVLCGHIHESPLFSNSHIDFIGRTMCINPGSGETLHASIIEVEGSKVLHCEVVYYGSHFYHVRYI